MQAWLNSASYYALKLWAQIIKKGRQMMKRHPYPGELLREDVLMPLGIEITDAAQRLGMSRTALSRVINGRAGILASLILAFCCVLPANAVDVSSHSFSIGEKDFLLDGSRYQIRCGEIHFERIPRKYWRNRLRQCKAMGLNTVCAYLFWNVHEWEQGHYDWSDEKDAAEFCREAQQEGLWVILRPGPYSCAEWEMGGLPWWLLKNDNIQLRSRDPNFMSASRSWLKEVGRVLAPLQVSNGGPILMVQVENEYGFYGSDIGYIHELRQATLDAGFKVPLFQCNPTSTLHNGFDKSLFQVANFGKDPENAFKTLREVQPTGPMMCGEFYPGWFDTWGFPHHRGDADTYAKDLEYMLSHDASFSIYMAHGGTSFGMWAGADIPFKPDTSSYDYNAPISESGRTTEKYDRTRALMKKYLLPGENLPKSEKPIASIPVPLFRMTEFAKLNNNLPEPINDAEPKTMEHYNQGRGCILYRTTLAAGPAATLSANSIHDFAWVSIDGTQVGVMDRRSRRFTVKISARKKPVRLDILVEAMGRVNFSKEIHDRKGIHGPVKLATVNGALKDLTIWKIYRLPLDAQMLKNLKWQSLEASAAPRKTLNIEGLQQSALFRAPDTSGPAFWRGGFSIDKPGDTFLDLSSWGKGVLWVNGKCLARFWNIGPTQTAFLPGAWLKTGRNEIIVLDLLGPQKPVLVGLTTPILDKLRPELDFANSKKSDSVLQLSNDGIALTGKFTNEPKAQKCQFPKPVRGKQFCLETRSSYGGDFAAAVAELDILRPDGQSIPHEEWTIAYVDSEEKSKEDGSAMNAINGQTSDCWHTQWSSDKTHKHPHFLVIDLGSEQEIGGFTYTPNSGIPVSRIENYRIYVGENLVLPSTRATLF
jgi:beta-galactosidase